MIFFFIILIINVGITNCVFKAMDLTDPVIVVVIFYIIFSIYMVNIVFYRTLKDQKTTSVLYLTY